MPSFYVGTSGFASPTLRTSPGGHSQRDLLAAYASRLGALEMDSSFYRPPGAETVSVWRHATGEGMALAVRMSRDATHVGRLGVPQKISGFLDALGPLGPRLKCVLFTTPPSLGCDVELVRGALDAVPPGLRTAWEFRHPSWACPEVVDMLVERGSAPAIVENLAGVSSGELLPGGHLEDKWDLPFFYLRLRKDRYRARELIAWGEVLGQALDRGADVFAFFKQCLEAQAYAIALGEVLSERR